MTESGVPKADDLAALGRWLVDEADSQGFTCRLTGSVAVREHVDPDLLDLLGRDAPLDIDLVGRSEDAMQARELLAEIGLEPHPAVAQSQEYGLGRLIFVESDGPGKVEVFLDSLVMSHTIEFRGRLELDHPTLPLADLLLTKLQVHEFTAKDSQDIIALLAEHELGGADAETIDVARVTALTARDWGLHRTAIRNLAAVEARLETERRIPTEVRLLASDRVAALAESLEGAPKSLGWRLRARIGERMRWYEEVEDVDR